MKIRNKKTGAIAEVSNEGFDAYKTFAKLLGKDEWVEFKVTEPLIKDEGIRKAVRAWAEANCITKVYYDASYNSFRYNGFSINFDYDFDRHDGLRHIEQYVITELCGEEEE